MPILLRPLVFYRTPIADPTSSIGIRTAVRDANTGLGTGTLVHGLNGDIEILFAGRTADNTAITSPGGDWTVFSTHSATGMYALIAWRPRGATQTSTGTFANASRLCLIPVYGVNMAAPIAQVVWDDNPASPVDFPAATALGALNWVLSGALIFNAVTVPIRTDSIEALAPSTNGRITLAHSNGVVSAWAAQSVEANDSGKNISFALELENV